MISSAYNDKRGQLLQCKLEEYIGISANIVGQSRSELVQYISGILLCRSPKSILKIYCTNKWCITNSQYCWTEWMNLDGGRHKEYIAHIWTPCLRRTSNTFSKKNTFGHCARRSCNSVMVSQFSTLYYIMISKCVMQFSAISANT